MIYQLQQKIELAISLTEAWKFFSDPKNLELLTPPNLGMKIPSDVPGDIYPGMIVKYRITPLLSIPLTWVTEITHVKREQMFVDEQRYGPYRMWHHQHLFIPTERGVVVQDIVDYIMPFGPLGAVIHS